MYLFLEGLEITHLGRNLAMFPMFCSIILPLEIHTNEILKTWTKIYAQKLLIIALLTTVKN